MAFIKLQDMKTHTAKTNSTPPPSQIAIQAKADTSSSSEEDNSKQKPYSCDTCTGPDNELNMSPSKEPDTSPDVEPNSSPVKELNVNQTLADIIHRNKEFLCVKCGKTCKSKSDLKKHAKLHGNPTKPYLCKMCNKTFRVAVDWNMHMNQQHTASERFKLLGFSGKAYRCYECHKKFKKASELRKHDTVNTEEEPFACSKCNVMLERE